MAWKNEIGLKNKKWTKEEFFEARKEVLGRWPTGKEIEDLDEGVAFQKGLADEKVYAKAMAKAKKEDRVLIEIGVGVADIDKQIAHMKALEEAGADSFLIQADTYTRRAMYEQAQAGRDGSLADGKSRLNGFPHVTYGTKACRRISDAINRPIRCVGAADQMPQLSAEIGFASGFTCNSAYDLHSLAQHCKDYPLDKQIKNAQYLNWLAGYYTAHGAPIELNLYGGVHGWSPPSTMAAMVVLHGILLAEQGGKHVSAGSGMMCNVIQDAARLRVDSELLQEYWKRYGYNDMVLSSMTWPWMGDWPKDVYQNAGLTALSVVTAVLGGANWIYVKSTMEAGSVPNEQANIAGLNVAKQVIRTMGTQKLHDHKEFLVEKEMMKKEARAIIERTIELGDGDVAIGVVKAVEQGVIDVPFSPWIGFKGEVVPVRDSTGALRYLNTANLPFDKEIIEYNREKIAEREKRQNRKADLEMIIADMTERSMPIAAKARRSASR